MSLFEEPTSADFSILRASLRPVSDNDDEHLQFIVAEPSGRIGRISSFGDGAMYMVEINDTGLARAAVAAFKFSGREVVLFREVDGGVEMTLGTPPASVLIHQVRIGDRVQRVATVTASQADGRGRWAMVEALYDAGIPIARDTDEARAKVREEFRWPSMEADRRLRGAHCGRRFAVRPAEEAEWDRLQSLLPAEVAAVPLHIVVEHVGVDTWRRWAVPCIECAENLTDDAWVAVLPWAAVAWIPYFSFADAWQPLPRRPFRIES